MSKLRFVAEIMSPQRRDACVRAFEEFWDSDRRRDHWPESVRIDLGDVNLMVLPLERVGAPAGESGASVFVAYYYVRDRATRIKPSRPFAVKMHGKKDMERELRDAKELPTLDPGIEERFAKPIYCYPVEDDDDLAVLVAPFGSVYRQGEPQEVRLKDLWKALNDVDKSTGSERDDTWRNIGRYVRRALELVGDLHQGEGGGRQTRRYVDALDWYLRRTRKPACSKKSRAHIPQRIFGDAPTVEAFGRSWVNPTRVVDRLLHRKFDTVIGAVHGDLHPKNVVLDKSDEPHIIDFGWARTGAAVVVDYVLMDINLRSITLPSHVQERELLKIARFLTRDRKPTALPPFLQGRVNLIQEAIWDRVEQHGIVRDWLAEYVIPFFIAAYGLLVYLDKARNQRALVATVLAAAEYIEGADRK